MIVIGITGGLAAGKTTISRRAFSRGYRHINFDRLFAVELSKKVFQRQIAAATGFTKSADKALLWDWLEQQGQHWDVWEASVHSHLVLVFSNHVKQLQRQRAAVIVVEAPLLFECGLGIFCTHVLTLTAGAQSAFRQAHYRRLQPQQRVRLLERQLTDQQRAAAADAVVYTSRHKRHAVRELMVQATQRTLRKAP